MRLLSLFRNDREAKARAEAKALAEALTEARGKWRAAQAEYARCKAAGDSRGMGQALVQVRRFATDAVRLEIGR